MCSDSQNIAHFTLGFRIDISLKFPTLHFKVNASLPYYTALVNMQWNVCLLLSIFYNILKIIHMTECIMRASVSTELVDAPL